ncbi:uncharacterized protein BN706_01010 [Clostridium sp. CAG:557]|nr:uncharacterized protein BN706_01010 [Clostridium sp. CAG:557]
MKLILAIVNSDDANAVLNALTDNGFSVTKLSTTGGFLKVGNTTFITGVDDERVDEVIKIIKEKSNKRKQSVPNATPLEVGMYSAIPFEITIGGATVFVLDVDRFEKL